jgi:1-phosphofructokinase family hexose kinase
VGEEVPKERLSEVVGKVRELSKKSDVTVISGGLPRSTNAKYYGELVRAIAPNSLRIVDATGDKMISALKEGVDLIKPNAQELESTLGIKLTDKTSLIDGCKELIALGAKRVLLSLGDKGAVITDGEKFYHCKSLNVAVNSTVGAGDCMVAATCVALSDGLPMQELLRTAVAAGTAAVTTSGTNLFYYDKYKEILAKIHTEKL